MAAEIANSENSRWCDEGKPHCNKCRLYGVSCNFMSNVPDLHPIAADSETRSLLVTRGRMQLQPPVTSAIWTSDGVSSYQLNAKCQDFITRYLGRSLIRVISPDDPNMIRVNRRLLKLAFTHPFLMHASLAVALTYDRHLNKSINCQRSLEECYHWSQSTTLLNKRLREPIEAKDKDPIWGTAAALAVLSFSSPDACTPEESWPMKPSARSDLDWLRMSKGKNSLWHIVDPLRPDSIFTIMAETFALMFSPLPERGIDGIPNALATVCLLLESSTAKKNPYFYAAHAVSRILYIPDNEISTGNTQIFTLSIHGSFEDLLQAKDPVALLLLSSMAGRSIWWIELRARVECPSICSYLRKYHEDNLAIREFLPGGALAGQWG
ncbi:hypothetical protein N7509_002271 [Penicillium cosmopolitanum]|uniref:Zn(2)-C6 fungal-type domain-containing protein n=1 Tax=Penicillium cosmopolitanum TaxID=1131564 RepID=A0A9X0BD65_9EURO|nr:uncharacterized protein N7509_002271 [Penicillium cosmopolitanum]KAJ5408388.1 hypothetical protein N7509_002271 [Penicillium cosmopolitanum]